MLGSGCRNCVNTAELLQRQADTLGIPIHVEKVTDLAEIAAFGVLATPGVVLDGKVVHAGGLPKPAQVIEWLTSGG